jgi:hypothetical protein
MIVLPKLFNESPHFIGCPDFWKYAMMQIEDTSEQKKDKEVVHSINGHAIATQLTLEANFGLKAAAMENKNKNGKRRTEQTLNSKKSNNGRHSSNQNSRCEDTVHSFACSEVVSSSWLFGRSHFARNELPPSVQIYPCILANNFGKMPDDPPKAEWACFRTSWERVCWGPYCVPAKGSWCLLEHIAWETICLHHTLQVRRHHH